LQSVNNIINIDINIAIGAYVI